jgi:cytochrome c5
MTSAMTRYCFSLVLLFAAFCAIATTDLRGQRQPEKPPQKNAAAPQASDEGERVFTSNCSRCHSAPTTLTPRVTGTVIMHMRSRARLSAREEQLLLKYLAP